jgi:hypothetical protein
MRNHSACTTPGSQLQECNDPLSSIICSNVVVPSFSSLKESFNTAPDIPQGRSENNQLSTFSTQSLRCPLHGLPRSHKFVNYDSLSHDRLSTSSLRCDDAAPTPRRKKKSSSRRCSEQPPPCKLNMVLDLLPWVLSIVWMATTLFGGHQHS